MEQYIFMIFRSSFVYFVSFVVPNLLLRS